MISKSLPSLTATLCLLVCPGTHAGEPFFNGKDLSGWKGNPGFWSVEDKAIVGHSNEKVAKNEFIWSAVEVTDFYLSVQVKLAPNNRNAGIQFRSKPINEYGQAHGYQADIGAGVWGKLYHEHGRRKLDWNNHADDIVKPDDWNHYEILAVGDRIWTAINGKLCVAIQDPAGERSGKISFQIHSGPPQRVIYRNPKLTHNPKIALAGMNETQLNRQLKRLEAPKKQVATSRPEIIPRGGLTSSDTTATPTDWPSRIAAADPGSKGLAWAQVNFPDDKWATLKLPAHFDSKALPGFDGVVWFRKSIVLSAAQAKASKATLQLGKIDDMDVTWVNGQRVGGYEEPGHHYTLRNYPLEKDILRSGENIIAVRVMDHGLPGGISGTPNQLFLKLDEEKISLADEWHYRAGASLKNLKQVQPNTPTKAIGKFNQQFKLNENDVVAFLGGSQMVKQVQSAYLEGFLTRFAKNQTVSFRDLSWQADTVYRQQRPRNFGSQLEMMQRVNATVAVLDFGQMESMQRTATVEEFIKTYETLIDQELVPRTQKIVLVTPRKFSASGDPLLPDLSIHNESVEKHSKAILELASQRGWLSVDLSQLNLDGYTIDGLQLTREGHQRWATEVARQLLGDSAATLPPDWDKVQKQIQAKNTLWHRHWRPHNWAFLYGNRQHTASSKDHSPGKPRWFPKEIDSIIPMIHQAENKIQATQNKLKK